MAAVGGVRVLFESKGIDGHGRAITVGGAAQDTVARGVVDVELCVVGACIPTDEMVKQVIGHGAGIQRGRRFLHLSGAEWEKRIPTFIV
ncbi:MAG: hypothetical protein ACXWPS_15295 [Ktedonobacteraceae bacterium]